ncbi:hypothetical protein [Ramlibacter sp.]|uniref:hypothetical protein n=1 Tax=Ramlibacter sp. TaxID=1917967 RepID=UPI002C41EAF9|nr:hypothetical protein [Ramlibacter sp.]HWI83805.1 hypothetical protein [Ramlibacter sp.]
MQFQDPPASPCCDIEHSCVFSKALVARAASCELSQRSCAGEHGQLACTSPAARIACGDLANLLHERGRSAMHLPPPGRPLLHVHALKLQCGGLAALKQVLVTGDGDVHRIVTTAQERHGSLSELPWETVITALATWQPRRRGIRTD